MFADDRKQAEVIDRPNDCATLQMSLNSWVKWVTMLTVGSAKICTWGGIITGSR